MAGLLAAENLCARGGQAQVPVGGPALVGEKMTLGGRRGGDFENGGAFVHFVEHADVSHVEAALGGIVKLFPKEVAAEAGNFGGAGGRFFRLSQPKPG